MNYVVFSPDALEEMFYTISSNLGTIFTVGIYLFFLLLGVFCAVELIRFLGR